MYLINLKEMTEIDKTVDKIKSIIENYGLDWDDMTDDEISRLVKFYNKNCKQLEEDLKKSKNKVVPSKNDKVKK